MEVAVREPDCSALAAQPRDRRRAGVRIRAVSGADGALVDAFIRGLSLLSRQRRFHVGIREVGASWLERMTHPDPAHEHALLAVATLEGREVCVAEARYVVSDDVADGREFALAVADGWQGRGIGKTLLLSLGCHAAQHGVERWRVASATPCAAIRPTRGWCASSAPSSHCRRRCGHPSTSPAKASFETQGRGR
jgi:GNAT superfamily N-acetyltransferase